MSANTFPIFTKSGKIGSVLVTAANTSSQGGGTIGTDIFLVASADATNGSYFEKVRLIATATAAGTGTTATVARIFLSTQSAGVVTSANTFLWSERSLPVVSADSATAQSQWFEIPLEFILPAGMSILVTNHAAPAANTAWRATAIGGDY